MFYSQFILAKKGPLATIWIAAHLERKLRKNQITDTNIGESVDSILHPEVPIALRLSGHLLLGVVRIYSRKVNLLFNDCSEALVKMHQAFQSSAVDLPPGAVVAPFNSITLAESFDFDDLEAHFRRENMAAQVGNRSEFEHHVTARDLITLQDQNDDRRSLFTLDERFEDAGNPYAVMDFSTEMPITESTRSRAENISLDDDVLPPMPMEVDMDFEAMNKDKDPRTSINTKLQYETPIKQLSPSPETIVEVPDIEKLRAVNEAGEQEVLRGFEAPSVSKDKDDSSTSIKKSVDAQPIEVLEETPLLREDPMPFELDRSSPARSPVPFSEDRDVLGSILGKRTPKLNVMPTPVSTKRSGRKRKHTVDAVVSLPSVEMKKQLKSTNDICRSRQKAPSTEYEIWMSTRENHTEQKFSEPSFPGLRYDLRSIYKGFVSTEVESPQKQHPVDQGSTRKTRRSVGMCDLDSKEGDNDMGTGAESQRIAEAVPVSGQSTTRKSGRKADNHASVGQQEEPLAPEPEVLFDPALSKDDGVAPELEKEVSPVDRLDDPEERSARDIEEREMEAADTYVDDRPDGLGGSIPQGLAFLADSRDTDESANEMAGKSSPSDSGWSSRSRAVALYLKEKFETTKRSNKSKETSLTLESLLTGRTPKEAARLFFETLVLGTKGYLQLEQVSSYADIQLWASRRLLKAAF